VGKNDTRDSQNVLNLKVLDAESRRDGCSLEADPMRLALEQDATALLYRSRVVASLSPETEGLCSVTGKARKQSEKNLIATVCQVVDSAIHPLPSEQGFHGVLSFFARCWVRLHTAKEIYTKPSTEKITNSTATRQKDYHDIRTSLYLHAGNSRLSPLCQAEKTSVSPAYKQKVKNEMENAKFEGNIYYIRFIHVGIGSIGPFGTLDRQHSRFIPKFSLLVAAMSLLSLYGRAYENRILGILANFRRDCASATLYVASEPTNASNKPEYLDVTQRIPDDEAVRLFLRAHGAIEPVCLAHLVSHYEQRFLLKFGLCREACQVPSTEYGKQIEAEVSQRSVSNIRDTLFSLETCLASLLRQTKKTPGRFPAYAPGHSLLVRVLDSTLPASPIILSPRTDNSGSQLTAQRTLRRPHTGYTAASEGANTTDTPDIPEGTSRSHHCMDTGYPVGGVFNTIVVLLSLRTTICTPIRARVHRSGTCCDTTKFPMCTQCIAIVFVGAIDFSVARSDRFVAIYCLGRANLGFSGRTI
ncbi:hypothetical protein CSKR_106689, partial [Clonorchis sinensis]